MWPSHNNFKTSFGHPWHVCFGFFGGIWNKVFVHHKRFCLHSFFDSFPHCDVIFLLIFLWGLHYEKNSFSPGTRCEKILVSFWVRGKSQIFLKGRSKRERLRKPSGPCCPGLTKWCWQSLNPSLKYIFVFNPKLFFFCAICLSFCCFINLKAFFCPLHFLFIIFALFFAVTLCYPLHLRALLHFFTMKLRDQDTQLSPAMYNFSFLSHKAAESSTSSSYKTSESSKQWYRWKKKI